MTITLANLHEATEQQVFDQVARHLLTQNAKSTELKDSTNCLYRGSNGLKCAAGCLIADSEYNEGMEGRNWCSPLFWDIIPKTHKGFIHSLQRIHDGYEPDTWKTKLSYMAKAHSLNTEVLDEF